tara:strand:+ start:75 stop:296 length:222 start_codon:yes stop_codon:yes gene_type:complete
MENKKWYTLLEASEYIRRCKRQVLRYVDEGTLKAYQNKPGSRWLFDIKDLDAFVMHNNWYSKLTRPQKESISG